MSEPRTSKAKKIRGLTKLLTTAVDKGSSAIEGVQKEFAARPFWVLEKIRPIAKEAKLVHAMHDATVGHVYDMVRLTNQIVDSAAERVCEAIEAHEEMQEKE